MKIKSLFATFITFVGGAYALSGCSSTDVLNFTIPKKGYTLHHNIAYDTNPRQKMDIYVPDTIAPSQPVIVFFYGGSWQTGSKNDYLFVGQALANKGFITVIADYRLYPEVYFPDFMDDAAKAVAWTHRYIKDYGGNPDNLFVAGHSAGGYMAAMVAMNRTYLESIQANPDWIRGVIGIAGAYDFLPLTDPKLIALFSKKEPATTQPISYVRENLPPMLLLTGNEDTMVLPRNTKLLTEKLKQYNNPVTTHTYKDVGHIGIILATAHRFHGKAPTLQHMADFVTLHSKPNN